MPAVLAPAAREAPGGEIIRGIKITLIALTLLLGGLAVGGAAEADGPGCIGRDTSVSVCTPCDHSEWHLHVRGERVGTQIYCMP